jgi:hypothetical protein
MTITIDDPKLIAALEGARDFVEFRDPQGKLLNVMTTNLSPPLPPGLLARVRFLTPDEVQQRRAEPGQRMEEMLAEFTAEGLCTK